MQNLSNAKKRGVKNAVSLISLRWMLQPQDPYGIGMEMFSMRRLEPIPIKLARVNCEDNLITSTKQWIKEVREEIENGFNKKA